MKKTIFFTIFGLIFFTSAQSQEIRLGVKGGVNFASVRGGDPLDRSGITGYHLGVLSEIQLNEKLAIQPELLYSLQGERNNQSYKDGSDVETNLHYLDLPILVKYYPIDGLSFAAGPQIGILMAAKQEITTFGFDQGTRHYKTDIKEYLNSLDFSLAMGLEYRFVFGAFIQARYAIGLTNFHKESAFKYIGIPTDNPKLYNNVFQLSVGYSF